MNQEREYSSDTLMTNFKKAGQKDKSRMSFFVKDLRVDSIKEGLKVP